MGKNKKYCPYCGEKINEESEFKKKGWGIKITRDGKELFSSGCDGECENKTEKKILKG